MRVRTALLVALLPIGLASISPAAHAGRSELKTAQSWAYQLAGNVSALSASNADVVVIDADNRSLVERLKHKPGGGRRQVIAYLSIGEAERGRGYWKSCCSSASPGWLTSKTQGWAGNYVVRYWDPRWKAIVMQRLDALMAAGFDGVYLDRADSWESMRGENGHARVAMIQLIKEVAAAARTKRSDFAVIVQNAEELLSDSSYVSAIDAVAKESLFTGVHGEGSRNSSEDIRYSLRDLKRAQGAGKAIFVVEYASGDKTERLRQEIRAHSFIPFFGNRHLAGR